MTLKLSRVKFYGGPGPGKPGLDVNLGTVTVFVGPNNSGKSLALREIEAWCFGSDVSRKVVDSVKIDYPSDPVVAETLMREFETSPPEGQGTSPGHLWIGQREHTFRTDNPTRHFQISIDTLKSEIINKQQNNLRGWLAASYTVRLDGRARFSLADQKPTGDLQRHPQNHLWALFADDQAREQVRQLTEDAFGLHFVIDPTGMTVFRIRMSSNAPVSKSEEQALDQVARQFHAAAQPVNELSDGVQAFVGLTSAVLSLPHKIILVDEPEAFLHPPLARRLGGNLARISRDRNASLIVATHSSEFLIGCLEAVGDTSVIRFTYEGAIATTRSLSPTELGTMTRDPLLRSTGVLRALFHRAAVVTEADADRAIKLSMQRVLRNFLQCKFFSNCFFVLEGRICDETGPQVQPWGNICCRKSRIGRPDMLVKCNGAWPLSERTYRE